MENVFEVFDRYGKLIRLLKDGEKSRQELIDFGINKNNFKELLEDAMSDGIVEKNEEGRFILCRDFPEQISNQFKETFSIPDRFGIRESEERIRKRIDEGFSAVLGRLEEERSVSVTAPTKPGDNGELKALWQEIRDAFYKEPVAAPPTESITISDKMTGTVKEAQDGNNEIHCFPGQSHPWSLSRPPVFSEPPSMTKGAIEKDNIKKTAGIFRRMRSAFKWISKSRALSEEKDRMMDEEEDGLTKEILSDSDLTDVQKIAKYSVVRHLPPEHYRILLLAANNGIRASDVIGFLEEPSEVFNMDVVRDYVSIAMNDRNSDLRLEVARDLIDGKWSIHANGEEYRLFPVGQIRLLKRLLDKAVSLNERGEDNGQDPSFDNALKGKS